jgi:hypothetical protein
MPTVRPKQREFRKDIFDFAARYSGELVKRWNWLISDDLADEFKVDMSMFWDWYRYGNNGEGSC